MNASLVTAEMLKQVSIVFIFRDIKELKAFFEKFKAEG